MHRRRCFVSRTCYDVRQGKQHAKEIGEGDEMKTNRKTPIAMNEFKKPTAVIKINKRYRPGMTQDELYDITRGLWRTAHIKARKCDVVLSVFKGEVLEVYEVDQWVDGANVRWKVLPDKYRAGSYGFNGHVAAPSVRNQFVGRSVRNLFKPGNRHPVSAFNVI